MRKFLVIIFATLSSLTPLAAQHTLGVVGGVGSSWESVYPVVEGRSIYGLMNLGLSWRSYTAEPYVGCFGIDLEYIQRGFSISPNASLVGEGEQLYYYSRKINTLMIPIVWQPHVYMIDRRIRVFAEAAATFSIDLNSTFDNDYQRQLEGGVQGDIYEGDYDYILARDNRFGYGLAFGGGVAYLQGKIEIMARFRYYYGLSDVVRNRNKYYGNTYGDVENPFSVTPIRSPISSMNFSVGVNYHFGELGFRAWDRKKREKVKKEEKISSGFNYTGETKSNNQSRNQNRNQNRR